MDFGEQYKLLYLGTVADREDPEGLGRVRVIIPGMFDSPSSWALPLGTVGGGSKQRGFYAVPENGADVAVLFVMGDPERPCYLAGHWGRPDGQKEVPTAVKNLSKANAPKVRSFETDKWEWVFDDVNSKLILKRKDGGEILIGGDAVDQPFVRGTDWKTCMEAILDAIIAHTHGTGVGPSGPPANAATFTTEKGNLPDKLSTVIKGE